MRAFISIELPENAKKEIIKIQKEIDKLGLIKGKFTEFDNLHLTLKFLGEISDSELRAVKERLQNLKFNFFEAGFDKLGVFSEKFIRIVWISLKSKELLGLQKAVDSILEDIFPKEYRFMSHITIARPKFVEDRQVFIEELKKINFEKLSFKINKITLKQSSLTPKGAVYTTLFETPGSKVEKLLFQIKTN